MATGISFFNLPSLVQAKVIREHVSAFQKARTLSDMPEFQDMLESRHCWSNPSPEFFDFYGVLRSLRPGLYFSNTGLLVHGFHVTINEDAVSFEFCGVAELNLFNLTHCYSEKNFKLKDKDAIDVYELGYGYFFVNRSNKTVRWFDGIYDLNEKNECAISDIYSPDHVSLEVRDKVVYSTCRLATVQCEEYFYCPCRGPNVKIKSAKLESFYKSDTPTFKLHFRVEGNDDYVSINAERINVDNISRFLEMELFWKFQKFKPWNY